MSSIAMSSLACPPVSTSPLHGQPIPSTTEYSQANKRCHHAIKKPAAAMNMQVTFNGLQDSGIPPQRDIGSSILRNPITYDASTIGPSMNTTVRTNSLETSMAFASHNRCLNVSIKVHRWMSNLSQKHHIGVSARAHHPRMAGRRCACDLAVMIRGSQPRYPGSSPGVRTILTPNSPALNGFRLLQ